MQACQAAGYPWAPCVACQSLDTTEAGLLAPPELWCKNPGYVLQNIFPGVGPSALPVWGTSDEASPYQGGTRLCLAGKKSGSPGALGFEQQASSRSLAFRTQAHIPQRPEAMIDPLGITCNPSGIKGSLSHVTWLPRKG